MKLNMLTLAIMTVGLFLLIQHSLGLHWTPMRIIGVAIATPSIALLFIARIQLGRAFSVQAKASTLVTAGLYSRIRNPIYVFGSLAVTGLILWIERPWLLLGLAILIPMQIIRSRREEQVLTEKFGAEYLLYKRGTWF
jgi:protein-S-isoprenylcysteine O-methyltransferase Ste14